jgi:hypothetical protein
MTGAESMIMYDKMIKYYKNSNFKNKKGAYRMKRYQIQLSVYFYLFQGIGDVTNHV